MSKILVWKTTKYGLDPVPETDPEPETDAESEPKLFQSRNSQP